MRNLPAVILVSLFTLSLVSCASVPKQDQLMAGIDSSKISPVTAKGTVTQRATTDPVCVSFYDNVNEFEKQAQKSKKGNQFMSSLGLNVLASVATAGIIPSGLGTVGNAAVYSAAGSVTAQGKQIAIRQLNSSDRADAKIIETAAQLGCPVAIAP